MIDVTRTTTALLEGLRDVQNAETWEHFDRRYRPVLAAIGRRFGLSDAEAADIAQETMIDFLTGYQQGRYDRSKGRLRMWLIGIQRRRLAMLYRQRARRGTPRGDSIIQDAPEESDLDKAWDEEKRQMVLMDAMDELRATSNMAERTIRAFELVALRGVPAAQAAEELDISVDEIYVAKSRCLSKLRDLIAAREKAFEGD